MSRDLTIICDGMSLRDLRSRLPSDWITWSGSRSFNAGRAHDQPELLVEVGWDHDEDLRNQLAEMSQSAGFPARRNHLGVYQITIFNRGSGRDLVCIIVNHGDIWVAHGDRLIPGPDFVRMIRDFPDWDWAQDPLPQ